jgi:hypothetical protein
MTTLTSTTDANSTKLKISIRIWKERQFNVRLKRSGQTELRKSETGPANLTSPFLPQPTTGLGAGATMGSHDTAVFA